MASPLRPARLPTLVACLVATLFSLPIAGSETADVEVKEIAPGVFAALQPTANRFNESNSLFVVGDDAVLVVDTQSSLEATRLVIATIRARTELPVRYLVLTHWHGDHVQGISAYREAWPEVEVIGHVSLFEEIRGRAEKQIVDDLELYATALVEAEGRLERRLDREGQPLDDTGVDTLTGQIERAREAVARMRSLPMPFALPDIGYSDELMLGSGAGAVRLLHRRAHTRGDTLVYLPDSGVLATGDVLDDLPYGGHGYPARWVEVLEEIAKLDFELIVPGHGSVRHGDDHLRQVLGLFRTVVEKARQAAADGHDLETTEAEVGAAIAVYRDALVGSDPEAESAWDGFLPATIERAWLEARGELPD